MSKLELLLNEVEIAQKEYDDYKHGKHAFLGSSGYHNYVFYSQKLSKAIRDYEEEMYTP